MTGLVIGGASSGKSAWAEELACKLAGNDRKLYVATMASANHAETLERIAAHQRKRAGKGFVTLEQPISVGQVVCQPEDTLLVECLSNLLANEIYQGNKSPAQAGKDILRELISLSEKCAHLVLVSNNIFEDSFIYDQETLAYMQALGKLNTHLSAYCQTVTEVVYGIPCHHKGG